MRRFASVLILIALLLSVGCSGGSGTESTAATPTPVTASEPAAVEPTATPIPNAETSSNGDPTPTVEAIELPTEAPVSVEELRAQAAESIAVAFDVLALPEDVEVAATVNGEDIPMSRFMDYMRVRLYSITMGNSIDWSDANYQAYLPSFAQEVLEVCIESVAMRQYALENDAMPADEEVTEYRDQLVERLKTAEEVDTQDAVLEVYGISLDTLTDLVVDSLIAENLYELEASDAEEEQVQASHILVATEEEANDVLARLEAGEDFATLAQELSLDTSSGAAGGDLGWFPRGAMVEPFEEAAFALEPGELSGVVETDYGYHIIKLTDKAVRPLDETWAQVKQQQAFEDRITELVDSATVERFILTN